MNQEQIKTIKELEQAIGTESSPVTCDVELGSIIKFARAIGDPSPLFSDEISSRNSRYGGVVAPPTFLRSLPVNSFIPPLESPFTRRLDGGSHWDYFEPIRSGDRITITQKLTDVSQRDGRLGPMLFMTREIRYVNQFDQTAAVQRGVGISY